MVKTRKGSQLINVDEEYTKIFPGKVPKLRPVFDLNGTITAANASTINDAGVASVLISKEKANSLGIQPLARILCFADGETEPELFPQAPAIAV